MSKLTAEYLIDDLTPAERKRAERVEAILPGVEGRARRRWITTDTSIRRTLQR